MFSVLTCLSLWTNAGERSHPIDAGGAVGTGGSEAVVDVFAAVVPTPAIDTDTGIAPVVVGAGAPVLAGIGLQLALVHILSAKLAWCTEKAGLIILQMHSRRFLHRQHNSPARLLLLNSSTLECQDLHKAVIKSGIPKWPQSRSWTANGFKKNDFRKAQCESQQAACSLWRHICEEVRSKKNEGLPAGQPEGLKEKMAW